MPYHQLFYHFVWAVKGREPFLVGDVEERIHALIRAIGERHSCGVLAVGGLDDHVHVVVQLPPPLSVADCVMRLKGGSARLFNAEHAESPFQWQREYGAFTCDRFRLDRYVDYVENQKRRHAERSTIVELELPSATPGPEVPG